MEFATGAMSSLIPKLGELLLEEYDLQKGLKKGIKDLRDELLIIEAALVKVSDVPLDQLDTLVKIWANDVRELSYAIEDSLDSFMVRVEGLEPAKPHTFLGYIKKACKKVTKLGTRRGIANDIKDIKIQVTDVKERFDRYKDVIVSTNARTEIDPRLLAVYTKVSDLVGIEEPMKELMKVLLDQNDVSKNKVKTVSIVGFGGLGKTTLAKAIYDEVSSKFNCGGFVPVGQNPDAKKVLRDILHELDKQKYMNITASQMDVRQLMDEVRGFLGKKRYIIVIDDIWDIPTWEVIISALVQGNSESRIIATTRNVEVAKKVGGIYNMQPLSGDNSKLLFHTRTCVAEGVSEDKQSKEVTDKILKKCDGVPLAIITIASLFVDKQRAHWSEVYDAIGFGHGDNDDALKNTMRILSFSYYDLDSHLKACLLYLSMFPEDHFINKRQLIWRWIIEGFVPKKEGRCSYELGEICFSMLVNRSLIRWIQPDSMDEELEVGGCRVHDMVLDFICTMSRDLNFVTVYDVEQHGRVRRLALHGSSTEHNSSIAKEHVRSFNAIGCGDSRMPLLLGFKVLRVLIIEECGFFQGQTLEHLGKLVQLRYLGLVKTAVKLPERIGHDLKFLEILDVRGGMITVLPPSVGELQNLRCLWADKGTWMKGEIGKLTCLEELQLYSVDECPNFFTDLGKLANLRVLQIQYDECEETAGKALTESLCNLHKIRSLKLWSYNVIEVDDFFDTESHIHIGSLENLAVSSRLSQFLIQGAFIPRLPSCMDSLCVPLLCNLWLHVEVIETRDLQALGMLPSLLTLFFISDGENRIPYTFGSAEFQKLEALVTNIEISLGEGALPRLDSLVYTAFAGRKDSLVPWNNNCPLLTGVICLLDCANSGRREVKAAKAVLRKAATTHPNAEDFDLDIHTKNYIRKKAQLVDSLGSILHGLERPDGEDITADQRELRLMITTLENLLRDADEPRVGRYGEQELRDFVTKFKSLLHDVAGTDQEEELENSNATDSDDDSVDDYTDTDDDDGDHDDDSDENDTEKEEAYNDVATSREGDQDGSATQA